MVSKEAHVESITLDILVVYRTVSRPLGSIFCSVLQTVN